MNPGDRVGSFRIVRLLGEGGMGQVYEAFNDEIHRRAAIKVLRPEFARDVDMAGRFANEARAVNIVGHPGIVSVFDAGSLPTGAAYIVMEFLDGESLRRRMVRLGGSLGIDSLRFARQTAVALAAAHARGIVHRDLKPDNVMVVADSDVPGGERVKVLDFGIAKFATSAGARSGGGAEAGASKLPRTVTGAVIGTPSYMAPEQCGAPGGITDRTDVYALGVMLFEMLAGRRPFVGDDVVQIVGQHLFHAPPPLVPPSGVPTEVASLVQRMLEKTPQARPSMRDVVNSLDRLAPQFAAGGTVSPSSDVTTLLATDTQARGQQSTLGRATGQRLDRSRSRRRIALGVVLSVIILGTLSLLRLDKQKPSQANDHHAMANIPYTRDGGTPANQRDLSYLNERRSPPDVVQASDLPRPLQAHTKSAASSPSRRVQVVFVTEMRDPVTIRCTENGQPVVIKDKQPASISIDAKAKQCEARAQGFSTKIFSGEELRRKRGSISVNLNPL